MQATTLLLQDRTIYEAWDRFVCSSKHCAGAAIHTTGRTIDGHRVHPVTPAFLLEWSRYATGPLSCQCGRLLAALDPTGTLQVLSAANL